MDCLSTPATYVAIIKCEHANSAAKRTFVGRENLGGNMFKTQICTQSWLRLASALGWVLPLDYFEALKELKASQVDLFKMAKDDPVVQCYYLGFDILSNKFGLYNLH